MHAASLAQVAVSAKLAAVKHEILHDLDMETAKKVARRAVESYEKRFSQYGFVPRWIDDVNVELDFEIKGKRLDGALRVLPGKIVFEMDVPFLFRLFTNKATDIIERETQKWIERARTGDLDAAE